MVALAAAGVGLVCGEGAVGRGPCCPLTSWLTAWGCGQCGPLGAGRFAGVWLLVWVPSVVVGGGPSVFGGRVLCFGGVRDCVRGVPL